MKRKITSCVMLFTLTVLGITTVSGQSGRIKQQRLSSFDLQSSMLVKSSGDEISAPGYKSDVYWFPVTVPTTVLNGLVANKVYPSPYDGINNMYIPDASDEFNKKYNLAQYSHIPGVSNPWKKPYWYKTSFKVPSSDKGRHFQLIFKGINYRAAVWVNGVQIADSSDMSGMFAQYSLDVTKNIKAGEANGLAVKIYPLDYPGLPATEQLEALGDFYENGGPTGDIGKNVTMLCSVGWDWMPPVRDRNMGIWLPVYLRTTGDVTIAEPKIVTNLPALPDTTKADVSLTVNLLNHKTTAADGKLVVTISPGNFTGTNVQFSKSIKIQAGARESVELTGRNTPELNFRNPSLWWPNGYGKPNLYRIRLQYADNNGVSDDTTFMFGIRTVSTKGVDVKGSFRRDFYVNGERIHITGGAWVPDLMLNRDSLRYDYEMHLCRNSNINLVRIWGGGVTPCDEFWEAADRYGLLVWSDFWVTGDTQGEFKGSPDWPLEAGVFIKNMKSTILRIRNHPSLMVWTGGNEGHARKELYDVMRESIITLDGSRPYIPSSSGFAHLPAGWNGSWPDNQASGVYSGGPYTWQDPLVYYKKAIAATDWVFKDETGLPSQPPYNILPRIIPDLVWDKSLPFPLNNTWGYHDAATGNGHYELYYNEMVKRYGKPVSMEDFSNKMQLMNSIGYQGIFEAAGHKLNDIGGVMLWKLNAALPSVVWQVYDWFLMPNAGYYSMQNAIEKIHIQLNLNDYKVLTLNRGYKSISGLTAVTDIYDIDSKSLYHSQKEISLGATDVKEAGFVAEEIHRTKGVKFVVLNLKDKNGKTISHNAYWLSDTEDYSALNKMQSTGLSVKMVSAGVKGKDPVFTVKISNNSNRVAFFIRPQLMVNDSEILPSFWSSAYFTLAPSESVTMTVSCPVVAVKGVKPVIKVSGWNVNEQVIAVN